jgi:hypothetical protein
MVAIVSKAVYQRDMPRAQVGDVLALDAYLSTNAALQKLEAGGRLFLLTVRPPSESLWLLAVLQDPKFDGSKWVAARNVTAVRDVSALRGVLKFENGKGLPAEAGKLGMALQTPRVLTADDARALLGGAPVASGTAPARAPSKLINLTKHVRGPAPCLCAKCLPSAPREVEVQGERFLRRSAVAKGRELHFWAPAAIADARGMTKSVASAMRRVRVRGAKASASAREAVVAPVAPEGGRSAAAEPLTARSQPTGLVGFFKRLVGK